MTEFEIDVLKDIALKTTGWIIETPEELEVLVTESTKHRVEYWEDRTKEYWESKLN